MGTVYTGAFDWTYGYHRRVIHRPGWKQLLATVLLPFALAHFISYLYRTVNAVVYPELSRDLGLEAGSLGLLTGAYFLTFAVAQIPIGVALDRYGPRRVQVPMLAVAAMGAALFAQADTLLELTLARGMIGLGVAGSLMAAIKAGALWFSQERLPLITSILLAVGGLGAMASTRPMQVALDQTDWRGIFLALGLGTAAVSILIFAIVPEHERRQKTSLKEMLGAVGQLYRAWAFWRLALCSIMAHGTYMAVQSLWLGPWLRDVGGLTRAGAADVLLLGTLAMVAGSLGFGWLSDKLRQWGYKPLLACGGGIAVFLLIQLMMLLGIGNPALVAIGFSFFGTAAAMNYAIVAQSVPVHLTGRVSTSFNLLICLLAFLLQWGMGEVLNLWQPMGAKYPLAAYQFSLGALLLLQLPGLVIWLKQKPWARATTA